MRRERFPSDRFSAILSAMIVFSSVTKAYFGRAVVDDVSFQIHPGEFVCLTGPSGAGKSTIVHLLIRAEVPTDGTIEVDGADLSRLPVPVLQMYRRRTGVLFQDYKLLSDRTVAENIAFALEVCDITREDVEQRVEELLIQLGLKDRRDAFPSELSGGEKTRTALGRALASKPGILIADEPTGNIDPDQSMEILRILKEVNAEGTTVILASHDQRVIDMLNVRVLRLEQGKLVRDSVGAYQAENVITPVPMNSGIEETAPTPVVETEPEPEALPAAAPVRHAHSTHHPHPKKDSHGHSHGTGKIKPIAI